MSCFIFRWVKKWNNDEDFEFVGDVYYGRVGYTVWYEIIFRTSTIFSENRDNKK